MPVQKKVSKTLNIIFNAQVSEKSMGGGDKIVLSIAEQLQLQGFKLHFLGSPEGIGMAEANSNNSSFAYINRITIRKHGFIQTYILRILTSYTILAKKLKESSILWSASDFLPDVIPGFLYKLFHRNIFWVGNMFLRARNPFSGEVSRNFSTILFFTSQKIALFLYKLLANQVCVLCQEDFDTLSKYFGSADKIVLISGGINTKFLDSVKTASIKYDACFIGRFHYQKGIPVLIDTWKEVSKQLGPKKLAIIGWGNETEESELQNLINKSGYTENISVLGFLDREDKLKVLKSSLILLFPSNFESWGVVIAEALGCAVPVVAFDLKQIKSNFKEGVLWSKDYGDFVKNTLYLLSDTNKREQLAKRAYQFSKQLDWNNSAKQFIKQINI